MVTAYASRLPHERARTDWRAVSIAVLIHAALLLALLASPVAEPLRSSVAQMVLVRLQTSDIGTLDASRTSLAPTTAKQPSSAAAKVSTPSRIRKPAPAARVVAEGRAVATASVALSSGEQGTGATNAGTAIGAPSQYASSGNGNVSGSRFRAPRVLTRVMPRYPLDAFNAGQQGSVDVIVTIAASGELVDARVNRSSGAPSLDQAAVDGVKAWTFKAAEKGGKPTEAQAIVTIDWSIAREIATGRHAASTRADNVNPNTSPAVAKGCLMQNLANAEMCH
jgi:protein TonB